jgi:hypothetical protein
MEEAESYPGKSLSVSGHIPSSILQMNGAQGKEMLKFMPNGDVFIHGRLAANDMEIVEGIREFLKATGYIRPKECELGDI